MRHDDCGTPRLVRLCAAVLTGSIAVQAHAGACPSSPAALCRSAGQTKFVLSEGGDASGDRLTWKWSRGQPTTLAEFGSPDTTTGYELCAWGPSGLVLSIDMTAGANCDGVPCWTRQGTQRLRYRDRTAATGGVQSLKLGAGTKSTISLSARGAAVPDLPLPAPVPLTFQLMRDDSAICFESILPAGNFSKNEAGAASAKSRFDPDAAVPALASDGCGQPLVGYTPAVSTTDQLVHDGLVRTFRVYVPGSYQQDVPAPVVLLLHGGFGSAAQVETSSRLLEVAEQEGFLVVSADGIAGPSGVRTWNAGGCCGYAVSSDVDDVGFVRAMIDQVQSRACIDRRRVYATGMSNGAMLANRLACDLADRIQAIAPVAGSDMASSCAPVRPVPVLQVHGSADSNVPFYGGPGCGPAGVSFVSIPHTVGRWAERDGCSDSSLPGIADGDATCTTRQHCSIGADVELCVIAGGGHQWPGGAPPAVPGIGDCLFGYQSQSFSASRGLWTFFAAHPARG